MSSIRLGKKIRDKVTGQEGIATARLEYLNGCVQYCLQPAIGTDGKRIDGIYIDAQQLEIVGDGIAITQRETGGPAGNAPTSYRG